MLNWLRKLKPDTGPERPAFDLADVYTRPCAILFKHSPTCAVSMFANSQVENFKARHPTIPVYTVMVRSQRTLSEQIAAWAKVRHESPQVIVLRQGEVVSTASHGEVTAEYLSDAIAEIVQ
jgi:bacillithiol system protein YtxJ